MGWATGAPRGSRVLSMRDLVRAEPADDVRAPVREIEVRLTGNMVRYIWSLNGKRYGEDKPIVLQYGERVRITFKNETMMAHPMHLHGLFFEVENGQPMDKLPSKNVIVVAPGRTQSILLTADEPGEWPLHCHLLFHMASGMMNKLIVTSADGSLPDTPPHQHL
jgi:FtsP/CotA-like multicopper oxidase with cupredoxin domain